FRLHATYEETIRRALSVFEEVDREFPIGELRWFFDHCETASDASLGRIKSLGGGIAVQDRMAFQGEYFIERYGAKAAERTAAIQSILTIVNGKIVYADGPFKQYDPPAVPVMPDWSPMARFGGTSTASRNAAMGGGGSMAAFSAPGNCGHSHRAFGQDGLGCS